MLADSPKAQQLKAKHSLSSLEACELAADPGGDSGLADLSPEHIIVVVDRHRRLVLVFSYLFVVNLF